MPLRKTQRPLRYSRFAYWVMDFNPDEAIAAGWLRPGSFAAWMRDRLSGLRDKFVVMYSGNHSPIHPLDTLLEAANQLAGERDIVFCFVGGGSEYQRVKQMAGKGREGNIQHPTSNS